MRKLTILILLGALCTSCSSTPAVSTETPSGHQVREYNSDNGDLYKIWTWLDKTNPAAGDRFYVYSSMTKNGIYLGGMMYAYWPDEDEDWKYDCRTAVSYQIGVCTLFADDFPVGKYIPIQVMIEYEGQRFVNETGFTRIK